MKEAQGMVPAPKGQGPLKTGLGNAGQESKGHAGRKTLNHSCQQGRGMEPSQKSHYHLPRIGTPLCVLQNMLEIQTEY